MSEPSPSGVANNDVVFDINPPSLLLPVSPKSLMHPESSFVVTVNILNILIPIAYIYIKYFNFFRFHNLLF